ISALATKSKEEVKKVIPLVEKFQNDLGTVKEEALNSQENVKANFNNSDKISSSIQQMSSAIEHINQEVEELDLDNKEFLEKLD
ncbi:MAG: hypothetical protein R6V17_02425, partial [Halanaerobacter sp.]